MAIKDLRNHIGETVNIRGFVDVIRDQKRMQFVILRDHTGRAQVVYQRDKDNDAVSDTISSLTPESTVEVVGKVIDLPRVKLGGLEIAIEKINVSSIAESPLPITEDSVLDKQLDWRHISLRNSSNFLIFQVQTTLERAMREYWTEHNFIEIHSPKLMAMASESGAELFEVSYFNDWKAYLAQSPQFYKQMAMAAGFDKVFEIGPVFRANPSSTSRHDTEFTSVDMEISWIDSHEDIMKLEEKWLAYILSVVAQEHGEDIKETFGIDVVIPSLPFPRVTLAEVREILEERGHIIDHRDDLDPPGERMFSEYIYEQYGHEFVFVTDYPAMVRPFYHMLQDGNPELTMSFDLLWKGIEITTGAQREHRIDKLVCQAKERGLGLESLQNYLNFFRYGCPPHGGCGVGLTRLLMILLNQQNVREVTYLYRGPNRLSP